jgi:alpha-galactosidase
MTQSSGKKIVFLGGGSTQFTPTLIADFILTKELYGSTIILVDVNEEKLKTVLKLCQRLIEAGNADYSLEMTTNRREALPDADFVIISVEANRFPLWKMDQQIPREFGIEQAQGENGGPGGLSHALRQIPICVEICKDVEELCPNALVLNLSNPMSRISQAVHDYTGVNYIGLCHEIVDGNHYLSSLLDLSEKRFYVVAGGMNHFTWYLRIADEKTGEDLYPKVRSLVPNKVHRDRLLVADLLRLTGYLCVTSDSHVGEYIAGGHIWKTPWAPGLEPFDFFSTYELFLHEVDSTIESLLANEYPAEDLIKPSGEIVADIIDTAVHGRKKRYNAFNLPNDGYISNLPADCIVEVPSWIEGNHFYGESVGPLPPPIAAWCNLQATIHRLVAKAAMEGDRQSALEALLIDPVVPDRFAAEKCLDALLQAHRQYLPRFFR